jgi:hypothetical protein
MCGDCWNAAMAAPTAVVAARFAWVGYRDRIPFVGRRDAAEPEAAEEPELVEVGAPPP